MKTKTFMALLSTLIIGGIFFIACQKEESIKDVKESVVTEMVEDVRLKSKSVETDCATNCIDPETLFYFEQTQQEIVTWGNPRNPFSKTTEIKYYNTLTHFVLNVKSSNGIANVLMDDESIKNFEGTVPPDTWQEITFSLADDWAACDTWEFELKIAGFGPPAYFDVAYQLIGGCVYYTLSLAVCPEGAGTVTGQGEYTEGEEVPLTATANEGWEFVNWTDGDGAEISNRADFTYTIPAYDVTLTANFEAEDEDPGFTCGDNITFTYSGQEVTYGTVLSNGLCWLDRNLGASRAATSSTDTEAYGDLYQWGRAADEHQKRNSPTTLTLSSSDTPGHGNFILSIDNPWDWRSPQNDNLWQGVSGVNNPCPAGYRLPTEAELVAERLSWSSNNAAGAFASPLKLPMAGYRGYSDGSLYDVGTLGLYWGSTVSGTGSRLLYFGSADASMLTRSRASGYSVRCLKD